MRRASRPEETGVSVHWLEAFAPDKAIQLVEVRRRCRLKTVPNGRFAELNVGVVIQHVAGELEGVGVVHDPLGSDDSFEEDPSHAQISGLPSGSSPEAELIGDLIAECVTTLHRAVPESNIP